MQRIKPFSLFIESASQIAEETRIDFLQTSIEEDYGSPQIRVVDDDLYSGGRWQDPEFESRDALFSASLDAPYGPITGPDCWESVDIPREEWAESEDQYDKDAHRRSVESWLSTLGIDDVDVDKFIVDDAYYWKIRDRYIEACKSNYENHMYTVPDVWNYLVINFLPTFTPEHGNLDDFVDTSSNNGDLLKCVKDITSRIIIALAYKEDDLNFYLLGKDNSFEKTQYTKSQSPEQIRDEVVKNDLGMLIDSLDSLSEADQIKYIPLLPEHIIDEFIKQSPISIYILDGHPKIKAGVLARTGIRDLSKAGRNLRQGLI